MSLRTADLVAACVSGGFAVFIFLASRPYPERSALMPTLIAAVMLTAALALLVRSVRLAPGKDAPSVFAGTSWRSLFFVTLLWLGVLFFFQPVGFPIAASLFLFGVAWLESNRPRSPRKLGVLALFAVATSLALFALFTLVLGVNLPVGLLFE